MKTRGAVPSKLTRNDWTRYGVLIAALAMNACLGATYAWAVFVPEVRQATGLGQGLAQLPFSAFYLVFPTTTLFAGALLERLGPRLCAMIGGFVFGSGWLLAGLGTSHFAFTVVGVGLLGGLGVGLAYLVPIATCALWFPSRKGLVTGVAVAGFGAGAALIAQVASYLMEVEHLGPFRSMAALGMAFLVLIPTAGWFVRRPAGGTQTLSPSAHTWGVLSGRTFWLLYMAMFTGLVAGFVVNANLKSLSPVAGAQAGVAAVGVFAITNGLGRIAWGFVFDRLAPRRVLTMNLLCQAALLFLAPWALQSTSGFLCLAALVGLNYGGVLVLYASTTAHTWGMPSVGRIYGWMFSANIPASIAPVLAGWAYDRYASFSIPLVVAGIILLCGAVGAHCLDARTTDQLKTVTRSHGLPQSAERPG